MWFLVSSLKKRPSIILANTNVFSSHVPTTLGAASKIVQIHIVWHITPVKIFIWRTGSNRLWHFIIHWSVDNGMSNVYYSSQRIITKVILEETPTKYIDYLTDVDNSILSTSGWNEISTARAIFFTSVSEWKTKLEPLKFLQPRVVYTIFSTNFQNKLQ